MEGKPFLEHKFKHVISNNAKKFNFTLKKDLNVVHDHWVTCIVCTPDNSFLFTVSNDCMMKQWSIDTLELIRNYGIIHDGYVYQIKITPCGNYAMTVSHDFKLKMFNIVHGELEHNFGVVHNDLIDALAISPKLGKYAFTGSNDKRVIQWSLKAKRIEYNWGVVHEKSVTSVCVTTDDKYLLTGSSGSLKMWSILKRELVQAIDDAHDGYIYNIVVSLCSTQVFTVSQDGHLKQWDINDNISLNADYGKIHSDYIRALAISPCGTYVFTAGIDGKMKQFDVKSKMLFKDYGKISQKAVYWIEFSKDGRF